MLYKPRVVPNELLMLKILNYRMNLPDKEKQHLFNLKKGYEGEVLFDSFSEKLQCECLILNDLLLKSNNTLFQIDSTIITGEAFYFYEVKNYEGDYLYENDRFYKIPNKIEVSNPLTQLNRSESLLRQLLQELRFKIPIKASIVFINPNFTLYQAPLNKPFIFPNQLDRHLNTLNTITVKLDKKHQFLAEKLVSLHIKNSPYKLLPSYNFDDLRKGIFCEVCGSFSISIRGKKCVCKECGHIELVSVAIIRSVQELTLLFPDLKITTNIVYDWCGILDSKERIRRVLNKNYHIIGVHQWAHYV